VGESVPKGGQSYCKKKIRKKHRTEKKKKKKRREVPLKQRPFAGWGGGNWVHGGGQRASFSGHGGCHLCRRRKVGPNTSQGNAAGEGIVCPGFPVAWAWMGILLPTPFRRHALKGPPAVGGNLPLWRVVVSHRSKEPENGSGTPRFPSHVVFWGGKKGGKKAPPSQGFFRGGGEYLRSN